MDFWVGIHMTLRATAPHRHRVWVQPDEEGRWSPQDGPEGQEHRHQHDHHVAHVRRREARRIGALSFGGQMPSSAD